MQRQNDLKRGRLIYCGAGTSGRLGALDAIELTPHIVCRQNAHLVF